jgi:choline dehydrogenase
MNGPVNWGYTTVQQRGLNSRELPWPRGKILGGSSAVNGMYIVRPSQVEVDAWAKLGNASDTLGWDKVYAGMKKSEIFSPPSDDIASTGNIQWDASSHGTSGAVHASWPGWMHPLVGQWQGSLEANNVTYNKDPDSGNGWGA